MKEIKAVSRDLPGPAGATLPFAPSPFCRQLAFTQTLRVRWWGGQDLGGFPCLWHQAAAHHCPASQGSLAWHSRSLKEKRGSKTFCSSVLSTYTFLLQEMSTKGRSFAENIFCLLCSLITCQGSASFSQYFLRNYSWTQGKAKASQSPLQNFTTLNCIIIHRNTNQL